MTLAAPTLPSPAERQVYSTPAEAARALAGQLAEAIHRGLVARPSFHLALSGGSAAALLFAPLAAHSSLAPDDWRRIHLWQVDERQVPDDDPRRNLAALRDRLAAVAPVPAANIHPMPVESADGDCRYETALRQALAGEPPRIDAVVLGMGADGHVASLFPGSPALSITNRLVVWNDGAQVAEPRPRMTLTFPAINSARFIALLVTGAGKRPALCRLAAEPSVHLVPVAGVRPGADARMVFYLDAAAA
jgi:6-phosphogluconolactonase